MAVVSAGCAAVWDFSDGLESQTARRSVKSRDVVYRHENGAGVSGDVRAGS